MKTALTLASSVVTGAAHAHPAFAPHEHPHGLSMLPGADLIVAAGIAIGLGMVVLAYRKELAAFVRARRSRRARR
jgi:hypothetical protein